MNDTTKGGKVNQATTAAVSTGNGAKGSEVLPGERINSVRLADIFIPYSWNSRNRANVNAEADAVRDTTSAKSGAEGIAIDGFADNIEACGQDTAIILRNIVGGKALSGEKTDKPLEVVCGFRRITAIVALNTAERVEKAKADGRVRVVPNTENGTILAVTRDVDAKAARILNIRENTARSNLKTQDLVLQVAGLSKEGMNQLQIAAAIGVSQGFVSKLLAAASLPMTVLQHWRNGNESPIPGLPADKVYPVIPLPDLIVLADIAKKDNTPEGEIIKRYCDMLVPPVPVESGNAPKGVKNEQRIREFGHLVGTLVKTGILEAGSLDWKTVIGPKAAGFIIDSGSNDYVKVLSLCAVAAESYEMALHPTE